MPPSKSKPTRSSRVRPHEADDAIFRPHNDLPGDTHTDRAFGRKPQRELMLFTIFGKHDFLADDGSPLLVDEADSMVFAKKIWVNNGNPSYQIKRAVDGRLFNPIGADEGRHNKTIHGAKGEYNFRPVNKKVFELYIKFLTTKNQTFLRSAERETF